MVPVPAHGGVTDAWLPRVVTYYQTHHTRDGMPISILPVLTQPDISVTHVIVAAIHINEDPDKITLNDHHPSHPRFTTLWSEVSVLQASGVKVMGMLGGAAQGSYARLDRDEATFERYWGPVRDMIRRYGLDGIDLDVEEPMSLDGIVRLIDRIRADFGRDFLISMAPVAPALLDSRWNLSGFDYEVLELMRGDDIAWYNAQFYNGWGDAMWPQLYESVVAKGWPVRKVVVGFLTNPENGKGWVAPEAAGPVLLGLRARYGEFGGVMGWEYFNSLPAKDRPWEWARWMTTVLRWRAGPEQVRRMEDILGPKQAPGSVVEVDADMDGQEAAVPKAFQYYSEEEEEEGEENQGDRSVGG
ncbi:glycoside hydrolase family 18 protein [Sodiomyces alcalophilus JCM 7366]|uniref:glycoside hydrolase family 18 protein n=1 Tax=Sodiomyces alcalophilus JCM 7366 TaxID=591952 RepID=UPI0039B4426A